MSDVHETQHKRSIPDTERITDPIRVELDGDLREAVAYGKAFDSMIKAIFPGLVP